VIPYQETTGEFKDWLSWQEEIFEFETAGPFYFRKEETGYVSAFRAARKHMNAGGVMHGGCLMAFADFALFAIAYDHIAQNNGVTIGFNCEFIDGPVENDLIEARGEIIRAGGSLIFVRGIVSANQRAYLNFSGTIKKLRKPV